MASWQVGAGRSAKVERLHREKTSVRGEREGDSGGNNSLVQNLLRMFVEPSQLSLFLIAPAIKNGNNPTND